MPSPRSVLGAAFLAAAALAGETGCSSAHFEGTTYRGNGLAFRTGAVPPSWQRLEVTGGVLAFRDEAAESTVLLNARCGKDAEDIPLSALTSHLFMQFTERDIVSQNVIPMDGREAMQTIMRAKLDGVPKSFDVFVLKKNGCVYDFIDISAPGTFESSRVAFEGFVSGFHTLSG